MKRAVSLILAVLFLTSGTAALARASHQIADARVDCIPQGGGVIDAFAFINGTTPWCTHIGIMSVILYEWDVQTSTWKSVASATDQYSTEQYDGRHSYALTYQGVAGRNYYAYAKFIAEDAYGSDTKSFTSGTVRAT
ncbi:MAG: hypothetical protein LBR85_09575 [Oscillospiraceae bacterium]|jgi:hypothetical protein|nr:hypothetical protein [Oscillospiraceae bacterium]